MSEKNGRIQYLSTEIRRKRRFPPRFETTIVTWDEEGAQIRAMASGRNARQLQFLLPIVASAAAAFQAEDRIITGTTKPGDHTTLKKAMHAHETLKKHHVHYRVYRNNGLRF